MLSHHICVGWYWIVSFHLYLSFRILSSFQSSLLEMCKYIFYLLCLLKKTPVSFSLTLSQQFYLICCSSSLLKCLQLFITPSLSRSIFSTTYNVLKHRIILWLPSSGTGRACNILNVLDVIFACGWCNSVNRTNYRYFGEFRPYLV